MIHPISTTSEPGCPQATNGAPAATVRQKYIEALREGERHQALRIAQSALAAGLDVYTLYLQVFQPAMHEIGRLWEAGQLTVSQEHLATAITRDVMAQIHALAAARIPSFHIVPFSTRHTLVAACVGNELHELGIRMVADFFELAGWSVYYLGAMMPASEIVRSVEDIRPDVLAISVTLHALLPQAREVIRMVRSTSHGANVLIMVGGQPFALEADIYKKIGADLTAPNAREAVWRAAELLR